MSWFSTKKYKTQSDLADLTAEQIVSLDPHVVDKNIDTVKGANPLTDPLKKRALFTLLSIKRINKEISSEKLKNTGRLNAIKTFLQREGILTSEADELILKMNREIMTDRLTTKILENRLRKLYGREEIAYTEEEARYKKLYGLGGRSKRKKTLRKNSRKKTLKKLRKKSSKNIKNIKNKL